MCMLACVVRCAQVEATALALASDPLVPAPAPGATAVTDPPATLPFYRLTVEGGNYYSFAEVKSPDCALSVVEASSQFALTGDGSAEATVDGDVATCFQTPESNMDTYGATYIVYACSERTRDFTVDTANRCGYGPVTSYVVEWSWTSDGKNGTWYDLEDMLFSSATAPPTTPPNIAGGTTMPPAATARMDERANVRVFAGPDCSGAALWGVESMDMCYYEFPDGNFTQAAGRVGSIEILTTGIAASTYETCFYKWNEDDPRYLETFTAIGCHNLWPSSSGVGAIEVVVEGSQLCQYGIAQGSALIVAGAVLLGMYLLAAMCPLVSHAVFVAQCCVEQAKRKQIVFRD
jgi:hypothetical protein